MLHLVNTTIIGTAHQFLTFDSLRAWSAPDELSFPDCSREVRVLGQEAIARNDGICFLVFRDLDDRVSIRIRGAIGARQKNRLVRLRDVQGSSVCRRVDGDCLDAELLRGSNDPTTAGMLRQ